MAETKADDLQLPEPAILGYSRGMHIDVDETEVVSYLLRERRGRGHVMLDVGAHFGSSAAYFDALGWTIHCFEPDPRNRSHLKQRFGRKDNIRIDSRAVSDKPAKGVPLFTSSESTGISGLSAFHDTHRASGKVDVTTLADVVRDQGIEHVDFLKIDVEGFDFSVLKGAPWDRIQPDVVECEFEDSKTLPLGHSYRDVGRFLIDKGYTVYLSEWHPIVRYGVRHDWRRLLRFSGADLASDAWGNILAFRRDPGYDDLAAAFRTITERNNLVLAGASASAFGDDAENAGDVVDPEESAAVHGTSPPGPSMYRSLLARLRRRSPLMRSLIEYVYVLKQAALRHIPAVAGLVAAGMGIVLAAVYAPAPLNAPLWGLVALVALVTSVLFTIGFSARSHEDLRLRYAAQERLLRGLEISAEGTRRALLAQKLVIDRLRASEGADTPPVKAEATKPQNPGAVAPATSGKKTLDETPSHG